MTTRLHKGVFALLTGATLLIAPAANIGQAQADPGHGRSPKKSTAKGPVGWDTFRHLDQLPFIPTGVTSKQFSSFDETGGNWQDGFDGAFSCLREEADGCVLAEDAGAGEITSIWFTRDWGDVSKTGNIKVTLDGKVVLDAKLQDVVDGKLGGAFQRPFVANADESSGGVAIKVPMTYRESMKVTTSNNPLFHHVSLREFADAQGVPTFNPDDVPSDVLAAAKQWGHQDPKPRARKTSTDTTKLSVPAGGSQRVASARKAGVLNELRFQLPQVKTPDEAERINDDGRAFRGSSQFTAKIDPANNGVRITRRLDSGIAGQVAKVTVDGKEIGAWEEVKSTAGQWLDLSIEVPAEVTKGKQSVTVKTEYAKKENDFNEFRYWVDSRVGDEWKRTDEIDVGNEESEKAHDYVVEGQVWQGDRTYTYPVATDPDVLEGNALLRDLRLRVTVDGKQTVDAPFGEFFGVGLSRAEVRSLLYAVDPETTGWFSSWWPMPYKKSLEVELVNESDVDVTVGTATATTAREGRVGGQLSGAKPSIGYFQAQSRRGDTVDGQDWRVIDQTGFGKVVGVSQTVRGQMEFGNTREYLEGDERVHVDGAYSPAWHGTGTEDFYEGGWYFREVVPFTTPFVGATAIQFGVNGCKHKCDSMVRTLVSDAMPFSNTMAFGIEHGGSNQAKAEYGTTAFWYGHEGRVRARLTDTVDVGDQVSEQEHNYAGSGDVQTLRATFEGEHDGIPVTDTLRATKEAVRFTVDIAHDSDVVQLRRLFDQREAYQRAKVQVDGQDAGTWLQPLGNEHHRWLEDDFMLPPELTRGKRSITVTLTPEGERAWSAARYEVRSTTAAKPDGKAPSGIRALNATAEGNGIALDWTRATDDVAVAKYEVYGSKDAGFQPSEKTLLGTSPLPGFVHTDAGLGETWYYRVRAVDSSGKTGEFSALASQTSNTMKRVELEDLLPADKADMDMERQSSCCGVTWSGGAQLWMKPQAEGQFAEFTVEVSKAGSYDLALRYSKAGDYGNLRVSLDGKQLGEFDGHQAEGVTTDEGSLGTVQLEAGKHTLRFESAGKHDASTGLFMGVDYLEMRLK